MCLFIWNMSTNSERNKDNNNCIYETARVTYLSKDILDRDCVVIVFIREASV